MIVHTVESVLKFGVRIPYIDEVGVQKQQQLKKLGIIIYYLDKFNHNWSLHTPRAQGQTALQSKPLERGLLSFQDFHPGTYGCAAIQNCFVFKQRPLKVWFLAAPLC